MAEVPRQRRTRPSAARHRSQGSQGRHRQQEIRDIRPCVARHRGIQVHVHPREHQVQCRRTAEGRQQGVHHQALLRRGPQALGPEPDDHGAEQRVVRHGQARRHVSVQRRPARDRIEEVRGIQHHQVGVEQPRQPHVEHSDASRRHVLEQLQEQLPHRLERQRGRAEARQVHRLHARQRLALRPSEVGHRARVHRPQRELRLPRPALCRSAAELRRGSLRA